MEGAPLPGTLKDNKRYIKREVKILCKRVSLSLGAPLGNLEGIRLPGLFEEKKRIVYPGSFLRPRGFYDFKSETLVKGRGSPELILDYGAQRARCIGTARARTQC
jgi:hypothetical protein